MNSKYRVISVSLIIILVFTSLRFLVFSTYVKSQKAIFRTQVLSQSTKEVQEIIMPEKDLYANRGGKEWKEKNKELIVLGVHYEVVKITHTGSNCHVFLLEDKAENELFSAFFNSESKASNSLTVIKLFLSMVFVGAALYAISLIVAATNLFSGFPSTSYKLVPVFKTIKPPQRRQPF